MEEMNRFDKKLDIVNKLLNLSFKFGVIAGGAVVLFYSWKIGYFPKDVSLGDGFLFLLLAITFGGVYLFFVVSLTSLGIVLRPLWHVLQNLYLKGAELYKKLKNEPLDYPGFTIEKPGFEHFVLAIFGLFFVVFFGLPEVKVLGTLILCTWVCALMWSICQQNGREIRELRAEELESDEQKDRLKRLSDAQPIFLGILLVLPLLIGGVSGKLLDGAMRLANVRSDQVTVHIKKPYVKYADEHGFKGSESRFGADYSKFENSSVLFNGFGKNVVIELYDEGMAPEKLVIPSDHVHII
ncbi:hypothetical protein KZO85_07755 [Chromohalobacter canadensis]|uniref:hypothetical protein n=1 Tax=Chromohalobacter canadensis TaxID=141389 RepID=UPI0021C0EFE2|nr:hypothetical protein [Chromohalobacter canadensis]MCT8468466.1 hypothetical protein [Chromohalobacter canadensis]MCT8471521.1 hypothetical protein [Chromohalobacter canadensis]MCT8498974.1 hypothetical protein [Chromohalobacter canadensis]